MRTSIVRLGGQLMIDIDGRLFPALAFKSFRPNPRNVSEFHDAGIRLYTVLSSGIISGLGIPYSLYGESWVGPGQYDFSPIDRQMEMFMENAPEGYFAPMFQIDTRPWYLKEHPDRPNSFTNLSQIAGDPGFIRDTAEYLKAVVAHCEEKYSDRIWGYFMLGGTTTEWFSDFDYEAPHPIKEEAYRRYLGDENASLPDQELLEREGGVFLEEDEAEVAVFRRFHARLISDLILSCASAVQSVIDHKKLLGLYFGYLFELGTPRLHNAGSLDYERVFDSPDIDMISSPSAYGYRKITDPSAFMLPQKALDRRNKLYFLEFDHRTHTTPKVIHEPVYSDSGNQIYDVLDFPGSDSACRTELESVNLLYRDFVLCEANGAALWWFDMLDGWFRSEGMMNAIRHMIEIDKSLMNIRRRSAAQVAVIAEGESMYRVRKSSPIASDCLSAFRRMMAESGAPYDLYSVSDLNDPVMDQYSFYIFLNQYELTGKTRAQIDALCRKKGKTILWLYAPDYAANGENSVRRIAEATGISVSETAHDPGRLVWNGVPALRAAAPHFVIDDPDARLIARFEDGSAAVAEKTAGGFRSIYASLWRLPSDLLRTLLEESGIFIYSRNPLVYTYANAAFLGVYNASEEDAVVSVPEDGTYFDHIGRSEYTARDGVLRLPMRDLRAYLLMRR
ncbi:MAG: hypothetical protein IJE08_04050 [Clostridia bacterium]|nr:hypothetical protein [Clostridia bacterium]